MFEVIGMFFTGYLVVGVVALILLYRVDREMRKMIQDTILDERYGELTAMLLLSLWNWPFPVIEHLTD